MEVQLIERAAELLVGARRSGVPLSELPPELKPRTIHDTRAIIAAVSRQLPEPLGGWKAVAKPGEDACWSPIYQKYIFASPARVPVALARTFHIETETSFRLLRDLPARAPEYSFEEVADAVEALPTFEVVDSRYANFLTISQLELRADHMAQGAWVTGEARRDWQKLDYQNLQVVMKQGDKVLKECRGGHPNQNPLDPAVVLANQLRSSVGLKAGMLVATGSFTGPLIFEVGIPIKSWVEGFGEIEVIIE